MSEDERPKGEDDTTLEAGSPEAGSPEAGSPEAGSPEAGSPEAGPPEPEEAAALAKAAGDDWEDEELDPETLKKLGVVALALWVVAIVLLVWNLGSARLDYYLGNMTQSLTNEGQLYDADIDAIVAMGPGVAPQLEAELMSPKADPRMCVGILQVLKKLPKEASEGPLRKALEHPHPQVRLNAVRALQGFVAEPEYIALVQAHFESDAGAQGQSQTLSFLIPSLEGEAGRAAAIAFIAKGLRDRSLRVPALKGLVGLGAEQGFTLELSETVLRAPEEAFESYASALEAWVKADPKAKEAPGFPAFELPSEGGAEPKK